ncbi:MAG TPA: thioredoxin family protein [bacterium]|jgi:thioredoxin 1
MSIIDLSKENFRETLESEGLVFLFNYSDLSQECVDFHIIFERVASKYSGVQFARFNVMLDESVMQRISVSGIPSVYVIRNGNILERKDGMMSEEEFDEMVKGETTI